MLKEDRFLVQSDAPRSPLPPCGGARPRFSRERRGVREEVPPTQ
jgi:hypothetical protein